MNKTVSVIIPCYNGEKYLFRLFDSLLEQTYERIQLIFVNDGSKDNTRQIFDNYKTQLKRKGVICLYLEHENRGQAEAINTALPYVEGEYLMWMDSDDFLQNDHIEKKISYLLQHDDCSIVMCKGRVVNENDVNVQVGRLEYIGITGNLLEDILFGYCGCTGGLFMVRTNDFFRVFKQRKIISSRVGQNLQILLPLLGRYKVCVLDEYLFTYLNRDDSHSHSFRTYMEKQKRNEDIFDLKCVLLKSMKPTIKAWYGNYLYNVLEKRELQLQMDLLCSSQIDDEERDYAYRIVKTYSNNIKKKSEYWIWGYTENNRKLAYYLKCFCNINIRGFYDSNKNKQKDNVLDPSKIVALRDFVVIPIPYYEEVLCRLKKLGMESNNDYFYLDYEIKDEIRGKNEKSRDCDISIC